MSYRIYWILLTALFASTQAGAQQGDSAIVVGSVLDPAEAPIAAASLKLTHSATGANVAVVTDERGQYRTPPLRIGEYSLVIEAPGFKRWSQQGLVLNINDVRQINAVLEIGQVSETVTVESSAPLLQASDSTVGTVITNRQIQDLPLNGRDYLQLAALSSGTVPTPGVGISIGGQAGSQAAFFLDGQDNNSQQISTSHSGQKEIIKPSVDAIEEFKVVTNGYSAEYGRSSSGVVSVALKSGSNAVHGTAYEFLRHEALDAKNYFATSKSPYRRNQYGASVGGPVIRDKTFFFADFEIGRIRETITAVSTIPGLAQRSGQFSSTIRDPLTRQPFPDNRIPASRIDPVAARIAALYPAPQSNAATQNFVYASPQFSDPRRWDVRVDHIISDKQNVYFRYSSQFQEKGVLSNLPPDPELGYYSGEGAETSDGKSFVFVHNRIWSPSLISSVRAGWNNLYWENFLPDQPLRGAGIPGVNEGNPGFSQIAITGYQTLGITNIPNTDGSQNRQLTADLTWTKGQHNIKVGAQAYWLQTNFLSSQRSSGVFNFNGQYTGDPMADFLLGTASSASVSRFAYLRFRAPYTHTFIQDDWRVTSRLTLNVGLRYELNFPAVEKQNKIANFDLDTNPASPRIVLPEEEGDGRALRALQGMSYKQFAPRFGFAYSLNPKTVVRGGYGLFYANMITLGGMQSLAINPPNHIRVNFSTDPAAPSIYLSQGFAADALSEANARNVTLISYDRSGKQPLAQQWNLNIQRQLPGQVLFEAGYFGNKFDHNWRRLDGNPALPGPGNVNARRRFTRASVPGTPHTISLADVTRIQKDGYSRYHGLQVKVEKRYSNGVTVLASYSWSKTIALGDTDGVQNPLDWRSERALASQDMPHRFVSSAVYQLPFGRGRSIGSGWGRFANTVLGGWSLAPILTMSAGLPLNLTVNGNPSNSGQADRPNLVADWRLDNPTVQQWFNTAAFEPNAPFTYGNVGRNVLRGPGLFNLDIAAHKVFRVTERLTAQLRLESFNATNTPLLGAPNTQVGNANFGRISSAGTPRDHQVGLKLLF